MPKLRFAVAQMNPTVGDYAANARKIREWIRAAEAKSADLIVFPETALSGYPVWDLANKPSFIKTGLRHLKEIVSATRRLKIITALGFIDAGEKPGSRSINSMAFFSKGRMMGKQAKRLLPTYDVFLDEIFFQPGWKSSVIPWKKWKIGPLICEDLWDDRYEQKPLADLARQKANLIVSISASPYYRGVGAVRDALVRRHCGKYKLPILYVNQTGGQDDLIFDGRSFFADASGRVLFRAPAFEEGLFFFDWDPQARHPYEVPLLENEGSPEEVYNALVLGIRDYCGKNGFKKAVIGLSGGIDSALVAALAVDALGKESVLGITMPGAYSSKGSWEDSCELAARLGIEFRVYPITGKYNYFLDAYKVQRKKSGLPPQPSGKITLAMENLQARMRGLELMFVSNDESRLLLTTGNKSELAMGYCTLYGDMAGGLSVIGDVYKTDVYRLCWYRNSSGKVIPDNILTKAPSAELRPGQKDEDSLPPYEILDEILYHYIERNLSPEQIVRTMRAKKRKVTQSLVSDVLRRVDQNEYKRRQTPPILRVTEKAWFGRRMPITNRFRV